MFTFLDVLVETIPTQTKAIKRPTKPQRKREKKEAKNVSKRLNFFVFYSFGFVYLKAKRNTEIVFSLEAEGKFRFHVADKVFSLTNVSRQEPENGICDVKMKNMGKVQQSVS